MAAALGDLNSEDLPEIGTMAMLMQWVWGLGTGDRDSLDDGAAEEVAEEGGLLLLDVLLGLGDVLDDGELGQLLLQLRLLLAVAPSRPSLGPWTQEGRGDEGGDGPDDGEGLPLGGREGGADGEAQDQEASHR